MSKDMKLPNPANLKEEILAKYPTKVARKRSKAMVINDPKLDQKCPPNRTLVYIHLDEGPVRNQDLIPM